MIRATLRSRIPTIVAGLDQRVDVAMEAGAGVIAEAARDRVHVRTGALRDSIHVEESEVASGYYVTAGGGEAYYGMFEEFGTSDTPSHPFLVPAMEEKKDEVASLVTLALRIL